MCLFDPSAPNWPFAVDGGGWAGCWTATASAASFQYFNFAQTATHSVVTETAEAGTFSLNGSSALLLELFPTRQLTLAPSYMENQGVQCSYGTDWHRLGFSCQAVKERGNWGGKGGTSEDGLHLAPSSRAQLHVISRHKS